MSSSRSRSWCHGAWTWARMLARTEVADRRLLRGRFWKTSMFLSVMSVGPMGIMGRIGKMDGDGKAVSLAFAPGRGQQFGSADRHAGLLRRLGVGEAGSGNRSIQAPHGHVRLRVTQRRHAFIPGMHHLLGARAPAWLVLGRLDHFLAALPRRFAQALDHVGAMPRRNAKPRTEKTLQRLAGGPGLSAIDRQPRRVVRVAWVGLRGHDVIDRREAHVAAPRVAQPG